MFKWEQQMTEVKHWLLIGAHRPTLTVRLPLCKLEKRLPNVSRTLSQMSEANQGRSSGLSIQPMFYFFLTLSKIKLSNECG